MVCAAPFQQPALPALHSAHPQFALLSSHQQPFGEQLPWLVNVEQDAFFSDTPGINLQLLYAEQLLIVHGLVGVTSVQPARPAVQSAILQFLVVALSHLHPFGEHAPWLVKVVQAALTGAIYLHELYAKQFDMVQGLVGVTNLQFAFPAVQSAMLQVTDLFSQLQPATALQEVLLLLIAQPLSAACWRTS